MKIKRLGAIDIGSNSVRLLITDVIDYQNSITFKKDSLVRVPLKLGTDTFTLGYITDKKREKLALLIQAFYSLIQINDVTDWRICATSAMREASNSDEVINYIAAKTGITIDIIDCKEEARYILNNNIDEKLNDDKTHIFADVGGGSTQMIIFCQDKEIASNSFRLGTVRELTETEDSEEWKKMEQWLTDNHLDYHKISLIGSGGNINKLSQLLRRCGRIRREELISYARKLKGMTHEERMINLNINRNRADVIIPAIDIYLKIMKITKALVIETPIIGVADGIIKDLYMTKYSSVVLKSEYK